LDKGFIIDTDAAGPERWPGTRLFASWFAERLFRKAVRKVWMGIRAGPRVAVRRGRNFRAKTGRLFDRPNFRPEYFVVVNS
jgi:hypothetical protein